MARLKLSDDENDVKALVHAWFKEREGYSYAPVQTGMGVHGIPDRVGCVPITVTKEMVGQTIGIFVGIEAKRPGRRGEENAGASSLQVIQLTDIAEAGGLSYVVDGADDLGAIDMLLHSLGADMIEEWSEQVKKFFFRRIRQHG